MGRKTGGIYPGENGTWQVDRWWKNTRLRQRGFGSFEEADRWLIKRLEELRAVVVHGERAKRLFDEVAAHYVLEFKDKASIVTETYLLQGIMPTIGHLAIDQIHDGTLAPYVSARLAAGKSHKTINLGLGTVRRMLKLAASKWRDENGITWLDRAPLITMLPLVGHQREPRPITWGEQRRLLPALPVHLARMSLFVLNTGVRDDVVCSLRWEWEIRVPQLGISVFEVPRQHVKGRRRTRIVVCNSVAQSVVEAARGQHEEFVFVWRRERVKNIDSEPAMKYRPIEAMNNTAWQNARRRAGLGDLHVHDLRHTVGMRLRETGVPEGTIADILWHSTKTMTQHYSVAQIVELHAALEKIKDDSGRWNKSLAMLKREQEDLTGNASPPKVPRQRKTA
jgi:integrase